MSTTTGPQHPPPEAKKKREPLLDPLKLGAGAGAAVGSTVIGSLFGDQGTLIGVALGSIASGALTAVLEHGGRHANSRFRAYTVKRPRMKMTAAGIAVTAVGLGGIVTIAEASTGKTLHGITTHTADYGTTFGSSSTESPSAPSYVPPAPAGSDTPSRGYAPSASPGSLPPSPSASISVSPSSSASPSMPASAPASYSPPPTDVTTAPATLAPSYTEAPATVPAPSASLAPASRPQPGAS